MSVGNWSRKSSFVRAGIVLLVVASGCAAANVVSMQLTAPAPGPVLAGIYISPYTALIGPAGQTKPNITGVSTLVICDDFETDVSTGTPPWQAIETNTASLQNETSADGALKFDQGNAAQQKSDYTVAAVLATEILQAQKLGDVTAQGDLSFALWGLFDTAAGGPLSGSWVQGNDLTNAKNDLAAARTLVTNQGLTPSSFSNVNIFSPTPQGASQEYIVVTMPEPGSPALLFIYLTGVLALFFVFRRRLHIKG